MKLVRFGEPGRERPGAVGPDGAIRDLGGHIEDLAGAALDPDNLARLARIDLGALPKAPEGVRLGPCVGRIGHFIAVGLNYADHAAESGMPIPKEPILFSKAPNCAVGPNDDVMLPRGSEKSDWEVELGVVMGRRARYISESEALDYVAGYCVANDVSERTFQLEGTGQWMKGKGCETFGPLGPWLVTKDEVPDPMALDMFLDVSGERMQTGSTRTMIFGPAFLVSYISRFMVLDPGDVIVTGTPPGVGLGKKPPRFLKPGDVMHLGISGLGEQRQNVVAFRE
jgi:2-keto-4-pentenoate hydratase/2-oxohepta-3-ene-1,7-dioic acid hydratase in catechol pathway